MSPTSPNLTQVTDVGRLTHDTPVSPRSQQQQQPDPLPVLGADWAEELSRVAGCLQQLGLGAASEEAYTRVINRCVCVWAYRWPGCTNEGWYWRYMQAAHVLQQGHMCAPQLCTSSLQVPSVPSSM